MSVPRTDGIFGALLLLLFTGAQLHAQELTLRVLGDFRDGWDAAWTEQSLGRRRSTYEVVSDGGELVLKGMADHSASGIWRAISFRNPSQGTITWRWKIAKTIPNNAAERERRGDDYAARVFVVSGGDAFSSRSRAICYVWAATEPEGTAFLSPYTDNVGMVVLRSGDLEAGAWVMEERDFLADYQAVFGEDPADVSAVALMVDTDDTETRATAWFDDIVLLVASHRPRSPDRRSGSRGAKVSSARSGG